MNTFGQATNCDCDPCPDASSGGTGPAGPVGPAGADGAAGDDGSNAYTVTTSGFTMPAVSASVTIPVADSTWMVVGQVVYVAGAGYFSVNSKPTAASASLTNLGYTGNVAPTTVVGNTKGVSPGGVVGATGAAGSAGSISPTTTKGDIIVDNGANSPASSVVRLASGANGSVFVTDSAQATGRNQVAITPNTVTNDNNIPRFNGTTGTPMVLQDSKLLITDDGAIQSTPSGGNARGSKAVDLQVNRAAATQVASGADAVIGGGLNNTASSTRSVVVGGEQNAATANSSFVGGGVTNEASGVFSGVCGGEGNAASADSAFVGGGSANEASGVESTVVGGFTNVASGSDSFIGGGNSGIASGANSTVAGGNANTASGDYSTVPGGKDALADKYGQEAHASGKFAAQGDSQVSELIARRATTDATASNLFLDGASLRLVIALNTSWGFEIILVGRSSAGVTAVWSARGGIQNVAGTVTMVAACTATVLADGTGATWGVAGGLLVTADNVNKALNLVATGAAATNIRWTAKVSLVEIVY